MFTVDSLPPSYFEEKSAAYAAKIQREQEAAAKAKAQSCSSTPSTTASSSRANTPPQHAAQTMQAPSPQTLTQAILQQQSKTRQAPPGFLGGVFKGFAKAASAPASAVSTPIKEKSFAEMEALSAERRRDADICAMPSW